MVEHRCIKCHLTPDDVEFGLRPSGTLKSYCKLCQNEYSKDHYKLNKHRHNKRRAERSKQQIIVLRNIAREAKNKPCVDCGKAYGYWVMQFDHVHGTKEFNVSAFVRYAYNAQRLSTEIAKCEVVCANCHMERTHKRRNNLV